MILLTINEKRNPKKYIKTRPVIVPPATNGIIRFNIDFNNASTDLLHFYYLQHILLEWI